jgi:hypothetical protein
MITQSHSMENLCFFQISIFNVIILPFFGLISNSFTANSFLFLFFASKIKYSKISYFPICFTNSFWFNKNHLLQKFIQKNGKSSL